MNREKIIAAPTIILTRALLIESIVYAVLKKALSTTVKRIFSIASAMVLLKRRNPASLARVKIFSVKMVCLANELSINP